MEKPGSTKLEKLHAKREAIEAQIRQTQARERQQERKRDTRRKVLAGAAVIEEAERRPEFKKELVALLGRFLIRPDDRALFGFPALVSSGPELSIVQPSKLEDATAEASETQAA